jgi:Ca2+/Na+ antiporter
MGVLALIMSGEWPISLAFLFVGIITTIDPNNASDYSGAMYFMFAFHRVKSKRYAIAIISITALSLSIRMTNFNMSIYQAFYMMLAFSASYMFYYFLIYRQYEQHIKSKIRCLTAEENKLLELLANGESQENAGSILGYNKSDTNKKLVRKIKDKMGRESLYEIIATYSRNK